MRHLRAALPHRTVRQIEDQLREAQIFVERRPPCVVGEPLIDEIRLQAFRLGRSIQSLGDACGAPQYFTRAPKGSVDLARIAAAAAELGGALAIEWEPLEGY